MNQEGSFMQHMRPSVFFLSIRKRNGSRLCHSYIKLCFLISLTNCSHWLQTVVFSSFTTSQLHLTRVFLPLHGNLCHDHNSSQSLERIPSQLQMLTLPCLLSIWTSINFIISSVITVIFFYSRLNLLHDIAFINADRWWKSEHYIQVI